MIQFSFKKLIIISLILTLGFSASHLKAQDYKKYNYYNDLAKYHDSEDSVKYYKNKALTFANKPLPGDRIYWMKRYAEEKNEEKALEYFKYLSRKGYTYKFLFETFNINTSEYLKEKLKTIKEIPDIDYDFIIEFSEYVGAEQFVRSRLFYDRVCMGKYMNEVDSLNHTRLKDYIDKKGYPNASRLGRHYHIPELLIMHIITNQSRKENWYGYYRPLLMVQAKTGEVSYSFIARLDDRFHERYDNYQLYGLWYMSEKPIFGMTNEEARKVPKKLTSPIKDIENLDKRRAEMGLPPFYMEAEAENIELPKGYKQKKIK